MGAWPPMGGLIPGAGGPLIGIQGKPPMWGAGLLPGQGGPRRPGVGGGGIMAPAGGGGAESGPGGIFPC